MHIADYVTLDRILPTMRSVTKQEAIGELGRLVADGSGKVPADEVERVLRAREDLASTGVGEEIAIPHGKLDGVELLTVAIGRSPDGVEFASVDGKPTRLFFVLVAPQNSSALHLKALARISRLCKEPGFRERLLGAAGKEEMYAVLRDEEARLDER